MDPILGLGFFALVSYVFLAIFILGAWLQGLVLAFRAHFVIGIICLIFHVPLVLIGVLYWFFDFDLPAALVRAMRS
jgi:hypothetical protein